MICRAISAPELHIAVSLRALMNEELGGKPADSPDASWRERYVTYYATRIASGDAAVFFAEVERDPVGMAAVYRLVNHRSEITLQASAWVSSVYVVTAWRRKGVASQLMRHAIAWARRKGCVVVRLRPSHMARELYGTLGFAPSDELQLPL